MGAARWAVGTVGAVTMFALARPVRAQPEPAPADDPSAEPARASPRAATMGTITGTVEAPELDAPLAGATVTIVGSKAVTTTDDEGRYELSAPPGVRTVRATVPGFRPEERIVNVIGGAAAPLDFALSTQLQLNETIVVVGARTPRTNVEATVPIDVVSRDDIARSGRTQTSRVLHSLAPSYLSTPQTISDGSDHIDPASLRGLGPDQVLILVNGKRRHRSALLHVNSTFGRGTVGTDLNAIAVGSIERIEILRDGAATQYGSDAIAGVINIVTRDTTAVVDVSSQAGITASRDGAQLKTSVNYGFKLGQGFVNVTGEFLQREATDRAGAYTGTVYSDDPVLDAQLLDARGRSSSDFAMKIGEAASTAGIGAYNLEVPVAPAVVLYSFGDLSHRRGRATGFYRLPKDEAQNVPQLFPTGFLPVIRPTLDDSAVTVGMRRRGAWNVDASLTHGTSSFRFDIENSVNASLGTSSPTTFAAGSVRASGTVANFDLLHKLSTRLVRAAAIVLGSELRVERYQIVAGDEPSYALGESTYGNPPQPKLPGAQVFPGFQPNNEIDRTRDNIGVYGGVESSITRRIALDAGGRFENYSDFGQSWIGKVAGRATLAPGLALRSAASTGFRAPSLQQLWFSNVSTLFLPDSTGVLQPAQVLTSNNASPVTRAFGIPQLREERSTNLSGGVAYRPLDNLSLSLDGYVIRLRDRIVLTSQFTSDNPIVADILSPFAGVSQAQFFANAVNTDTKGLDVVADYALATSAGTLTLSLLANFSKTEVTRVNLPRSLRQRFSEDPAQLRTFFFGRAAQNQLEDAVPRQKGFVSARYEWARLSVLTRASYFGKVRYRSDTPGTDETFGGKVLFDLDVGWQVTNSVSLGIGADNLLNTFPDRQAKVANTSFGRFVYNRNVSQFGTSGGFYYGKLQLTLF